jgi:hypothetical protein
VMRRGATAPLSIQQFRKVGEALGVFLGAPDFPLPAARSERKLAGCRLHETTTPL